MPSLKGLVVRETRPGPEVQTEQQILDYIRLTTATTWHVVGSCKMGNDELAVVDSDLRVRGMQGLRVIEFVGVPDRAVFEYQCTDDCARGKRRRYRAPGLGQQVRGDGGGLT